MGLKLTPERPIPDGEYDATINVVREVKTAKGSIMNVIDMIPVDEHGNTLQKVQLWTGEVESCTSLVGRLLQFFDKFFKSSSEYTLNTCFL